MKEEDIRPKELFRRYLELSERDARNFCSDDLDHVPCPACGADESEIRFKKNGFRYVLCRVCRSLYCSPRPSKESLARFYSSSESAKFWSDVFSPAVAEKRRTSLFRSKAGQIADLLSKQSLSPQKICDVGAGSGIFLGELRLFFPDAKLFAIEPNASFASKCRTREIETLEANAEESAVWAGKFDLLISTEVIEHVYSPFDFVKCLYELVLPGGLCLMTGLGYEGFDILILQEESNSVFPPHHLNFLSVLGFETLFQRSGFENVQVWTPGRLDVDIVLNSETSNEFVRVLRTRGQQAIEDFQRFLNKHKLSSHVWVTGIRA